MPELAYLLGVIGSLSGLCSRHSQLPCEAGTRSARDPDPGSGGYYGHGQRFNQAIGSHRYLTQEEFSNRDFLSTGGGCLPGE